MSSGFMLISECKEFIAEQSFLVNNADLLVSMAFVLILCFVWIFVYQFADDMSEKHGEERIQKFLYMLVSVLAWFSVAIIIYVLWFKKEALIIPII